MTTEGVYLNEDSGCNSMRKTGEGYVKDEIRHPVRLPRFGNRFFFRNVGSMVEVYLLNPEEGNLPGRQRE